MDESAKEEEHPHLYPFLQQRLPELGLDLDTYGPYVLGTTDGEEDDEDDDLAEVVQLLQASSESHGDDEAVWISLQQDIIEKMKLDKEFHQQKQAEQFQTQKSKLEDQLAQAKLEQQQHQQNEKPKATTTKTSTVDDATKQALMQRFGYEALDQDNQNAEEKDTPAVNNRQVAAAANLERGKELRSKKVQTKKEKQQETKEQRNSKAELKEERKKRTVKGERRR
jgi:hypothetical protein